MTAAFAWALIATFAAGIQTFSQKVVAQEQRDAALNGIFGFGVSALMATIAFFVWDSVPASPVYVGALAIAAGAVLAYGSYLRIEALKYVDAVLYFPISKVLGPILVVAIGVWWFSDDISGIQYLGIALSLMVPLLLVSMSERHRQRNLPLGLLLMIASTVCMSLTGPLQKEALIINTGIFFTMMLAQISGTVTSAALYMHRKRAEGGYLSLHPRDVKIGIISGILQFVSSASFLVAISLGLVSIVYVIHAHYILIPIILSVWWYGDHINMRKFIAIVVSSAAIILLGI